MAVQDDGQGFKLIKPPRTIFNDNFVVHFQDFTCQCLSHFWFLPTNVMMKTTIKNILEEYSSTVKEGKGTEINLRKITSCFASLLSSF